MSLVPGEFLVLDASSNKYLEAKKLADDSIQSYLLALTSVVQALGCSKLEVTWSQYDEKTLDQHAKVSGNLPIVVDVDVELDRSKNEVKDRQHEISWKSAQEKEPDYEKAKILAADGNYENDSVFKHLLEIRKSKGDPLRLKSIYIEQSQRSLRLAANMQSELGIGFSLEARSQNSNYVNRVCEIEIHL